MVYRPRQIVTNRHVVAGACEVVVALVSAVRIEARVVVSDRRSDLALLSIGRDLVSASFARSLPPVGSLAVAIGNRLGFAGSVTAGVVSGVDRAIAISSSRVIDVVWQLADDGDVEHPFLGVQLWPLTPDIAEQFGVAVQEGAIVAAVEDDGRAEEAGRRAGDVILEAEGRRVASVEDVLSALRRSELEDRLSLAVLRDDERRNISVTTGRRPD